MLIPVSVLLSFSNSSSSGYRLLLLYTHTTINGVIQENVAPSKHIRNIYDTDDALCFWNIIYENLTPDSNLYALFTTCM